MVSYGREHGWFGPYSEGERVRQSKNTPAREGLTRMWSSTVHESLAR